MKGFWFWLECVFTDTPLASVTRLKKRLAHMDELDRLLDGCGNDVFSMEDREQIAVKMAETRGDIIEAHLNKHFRDWTSRW